MGNFYVLTVLNDYFLLKNPEYIFMFFPNVYKYNADLDSYDLINCYIDNDGYKVIPELGKQDDVFRIYLDESQQ